MSSVARASPADSQRDPGNPADDQHRRADIQGLRGIAILLVVAFHAGLDIPGGFVGVDIFFVISGFVITALLLRETAARGGIDLKRFYRRRARRLLPALALMTSVTVIAAMVLQSAVNTGAGQSQTAQTGLGATFFVANFVLYWTASSGGYFGVEETTNPLLHTWSLSVEEQFYFIFPSLLLLALWFARRRLNSPRRWIAVAIVTVGIGSFVLCLTLSGGSVSLPGVTNAAAFNFYSPFTRSWEFAVGAVVALGVHRLARLPDRDLTAAGIIGILGIICSALLITSRTVFPGIATLLPVLATALVLAAGVKGGRGAVPAILGTAPLRVTGGISYSWYLWHWPFIVFASILLPDAGRSGLIAACLSLIPAILAYRFLENPIRLGQSPIGANTGRLVAVCLTIPAVLAVALWAGAASGWGSANTVSLQRTRDAPTAAAQRNCFHTGTVVQAEIARCRWPVAGSRGEVLLVGDSHSEALSTAVVRAGNSLGYDVVAVTGVQCPYSAPPIFGRTASAAVANCDELNRWLTQYALGDNGIRLVVSSQFTGKYLPVNDVDPVSKLAAANAAILRPLQVAGLPILMIGDVPAIGTQDVPCWYGVGIGPRCWTARSSAERSQAGGLAVERAVHAALPRVTYWSPFDTLCSSGRCISARGPTMLYRDTRHLNSYGSAYLRPRIESLMAESLHSGER